MAAPYLMLASTKFGEIFTVVFRVTVSFLVPRQ